MADYARPAWQNRRASEELPRLEATARELYPGQYAQVAPAAKAFYDYTVAAGLALGASS